MTTDVPACPHGRPMNQLCAECTDACNHGVFFGDPCDACDAAARAVAATVTGGAFPRLVTAPRAPAPPPPRPARTRALERAAARERDAARRGHLADQVDALRDQNALLERIAAALEMLVRK